MAVGICGCSDDTDAVDAGNDASTTDADAAPSDAAAPVDAGSPIDADADASPFHDGPPPAQSLCNPETSPEPYPEANAWPANNGPGGPAETFTEDALYQNCTFLSGHETDSQHHNLVTMYDGYLLMPWAPEWGHGGLTLWDVSNPCSPVERGLGVSPTMRETHALGFSHYAGGAWTVVNHMEETLLMFGEGGVEIWNLDDTTAPTLTSELNVPGFFYPDAYARVSQSVFFQAPYLYIGTSQNGIYIGDASDPTQPVLLSEYAFEPTLQVGQVQAIGNLLVVSAAEGPRAVLLDISDPAHPMPIPGGDFVAMDGEGTPREAYFTNVADGYLWFSRKDSGAGVVIYDIRDPSNPTYVGDYRANGSGGYVFVKDGFAFQGAGDAVGGWILDARDPTDIQEVANLALTGDLDTITPIGNVAVLSVDADAEDNQGSAVAPWQREPDTQPPAVNWAWPADGATGLPLTSRFGVGFNEFVDAKSAFEGSVRLYETATGNRVDGIVSTQEVLVNFHPRCPLQPSARYTLEITAGGIVDFNGNAVAETFTIEVTTAGG